MTREERQSLLHEGQGSVISAFVEILFDNQDNRFPTGKDQVILRRSIGLKKDEYSLDRKTVTKSEVLNLLESAGFSRSNPYYIVPQGRITALTNAKDPERLTLLKEVAGTKVYEQKRIESLKIMDETLGKRDQIEELLEYIEERLEELEEEKQELQEYLAADKERRCLEYAIYYRDQSDTISMLEELEEDRLSSQTQTVELYKAIADRQLEIVEVEKALNEKKTELGRLVVEKEQAQQDVSEGLKSKAQVVLELEDLESGLSETSATRSKLIKEKKSIQVEMKEKQKRLDSLAPEFSALLTKEASAKEKLQELESQLEHLTSKQGRHDRFKNAAERDEWLRSTISDLNAALKTTQDQLKQSEATTSSTADEVESLKATLVKLEERVSGRRTLVESIDSEFHKFLQKKEDLELERKNLWREEAKLTSTFDNLKQEHDKNYRSIMSTMDKNTAKGLKSVARIVENLGLQGYYGPLYDLFTVDESLQTAVEVVAGSSLFHLVVDTDQTATAILEVLNREKGGRVTFMPLNRLKPKESRYPDSEQAIPLMSRLEYDDRFHPAMLQVFGKAILAPTLEEASAFARSHGLTGITFEGDRADRKGALTGGFVDFNQSRLECISVMRATRERMNQDQRKLQDIKLRLLALDQEILTARDQLSLIDGKKRALLSGREPIVSEIGVKKERLEQLEGYLVQATKTRDALKSDMAVHMQQIELSRKELGSPFRKQLDSGETARLAKLPGLVEEARARQGELIASRTKLETLKNQLEIFINSNLARSLADIDARIGSLQEGGNDSDSRLVSRRNQLKAIEKTLGLAAEKLQEIENSSEELEESISQLNSSLEKMQTDQQNDHLQVERKQRVMDKFLARKSVLMQKKETALGHIRDLGVLPEGAFDKYQDVEAKNLLSSLHKVNEVLKKYSHVNKKAFEQYGNFTKQREQLQNRKGELDSSAKSIEKLITTLDMRKNEAIDRTFEHVAANFAEVWSKLVPEGEGELLMIRRSDEPMLETQSQQPDNTQTTNSTADYIGVSLKVSFQSGQQLRMAQLSGGQKSLVALALIFAIQKCDPAPFYLFDEIDAALDTQYRTAVADMVKELSKNAQFITTTFRPELLVHANKFYGVTFSNKVSKIQSITRENANTFVESQAATS